MLKIGFYVPDTHLEEVKDAMFDAGAGKVGEYDRCCWQCFGQGQFRPLEGSDPHLGEQDEEERVPEWRVEMVCDDKAIKAVVAALREAHPYEAPAFDVVPLLEF
ncbi:MAG TPA: YqfO family protein [Candidatus Acidoferrum sp.]|nr:YqfO family protein [Candidatus Acidoferrum sp.]